MSHNVAVIPARYASTRFPGKPLIKFGDKTMIQLVYEQVKKSKLVDRVIVATDDNRIAEVVKAFDGKYMMTAEDHSSGTDRIAELVAKNSDWSVIVNVQGDEPFIDPNEIDSALEPFTYDPDIKMLSAYHMLSGKAAFENPNNVKVILDQNSDAMYFSRSPIPFDRDGIDDDIEFKKHIGMYAYRRDTILTIANMPATILEQTEKLEQLRALENGIKIRMIEVAEPSMGIDTPEDYEKAKLLIE